MRPSARSPVLWIGLLAAALVAYSLIAHVLTVDDDRSALGYLFATGSLLALVLLGTWNSRWRMVTLMLAVPAAIAAFELRRRIAWDPRWLYLLQHAGVHAGLALLFARSMRGGRTPLITQLARMAHPAMPPALEAYTRSVNRAWTIYFAAMALLSLLLFFFGPAMWWSVLANFLTFPAAALMFVAEYVIRLRRFPDFPHASLLDGIRLFSRHRP